MSCEFEGGLRESGTVLIVEDEHDLAEEIAQALVVAGIRAEICGDFDSAVAHVADCRPRLILLDQRLREVDALLRLPELRRYTAAPIVFLTGNRNEADRVTGLDLGADDFLLKPIALRELVARVGAHLRRTAASVSPAATAPATTRTLATLSPVGASGWCIDRSDCRLYRPNGEAVPLSMLEFELLAILAAQPGVSFDRDALSKRLLRRKHWPQDRALDNLVHRIRRKIGHLRHDEVIGTVRSRGYVFRGFPDR